MLKTFFNEEIIDDSKNVVSLAELCPTLTQGNNVTQEVNVESSEVSVRDKMKLFEKLTEKEELKKAALLLKEEYFALKAEKALKEKSEKEELEKKVEKKEKKKLKIEKMSRARAMAEQFEKVKQFKKVNEDRDEKYEAFKKWNLDLVEKESAVGTPLNKNMSEQLNTFEQMFEQRNKELPTKQQNPIVAGKPIVDGKPIVAVKPIVAGKPSTKPTKPSTITPVPTTTSVTTSTKPSTITPVPTTTSVTTSRKLAGKPIESRKPIGVHDDSLGDHVNINHIMNDNYMSQAKQKREAARQRNAAEQRKNQKPSRILQEMKTKCTNEMIFSDDLDNK